MSLLLEPPIRQEVVYAPAPPGALALERRLPLTQLIRQLAWFRKTLILLVLAIVWEGAARWQDNDLLVPGFLQTSQAFVDGIICGELTVQTLTSMFNPLPAIALMPLALLWFGLGRASLIFVIVHSVSGRWRSTLTPASRACPTPCAWPGATMA